MAKQKVDLESARRGLWIKGCEGAKVEYIVLKLLHGVACEVRRGSFKGKDLEFNSEDVEL